MALDNFQFIRLEYDPEKIATITLTRADKHNAFNEHVIVELTAGFAKVKAESASLLILQAEGKSFSAGADLDWMRRMAEYDFQQNVADANGLANMLHTLYSLPMPTIAKVQGSAYGGGVGLVACCDLVVASEQAKFCLSEVKLGLIPATISPYVIAAVGAKVARRLFLTAELFDAKQAHCWHLVSELAGLDELDDVVDQWIKQLQQNSPAAMTASKRLVNEVANKPITAELRQLTSERIAAARTSAQGREGVTAFLEKRLPNWTNCE